MVSVRIPCGYALPDGRRPEDVLALAEQLLRSEGIDPAWPLFNDEASASRRT